MLSGDTEFQPFWSPFTCTDCCLMNKICVCSKTCMHSRAKRYEIINTVNKNPLLELEELEIKIYEKNHVLFENIKSFTRAAMICVAKQCNHFSIFQSGDILHLDVYFRSNKLPISKSSVGIEE